MECTLVKTLLCDKVCLFLNFYVMYFIFLQVANNP